VRQNQYVEGCRGLAAPVRPLPFADTSTREETVLINTLDPQPRSRPVFSFHRPDTLWEWLTADTLDAWIQQSGGFFTSAERMMPDRMQQLRLQDADKTTVKAHSPSGADRGVRDLQMCVVSGQSPAQR
jgi:hypothetical protein